MSATETETRTSGTLAGVEYNTIGGVAFAIWGVIHVGVGLVGLWVFLSDGTASMLAFVDLDAAVNDQAARMANLVAEFYQALLLVGLTTTVLGLTVNRRGDPVGLWLNAILVASIEAFFVWFEVLPGHRPVFIAVITVALLLLGVGFCGFGIRRSEAPHAT